MVAADAVVVLVVETPAARKLAPKLLREAGIKFIDVHRKRSDLATGTPANASVGVVELRMPGMRAARTLSRLHRVWPDLAVVGVSGHAALWNSGSLKDWGLQEVLPMPLDPDGLLRAVKAGLAGL